MTTTTISKARKATDGRPAIHGETKKMIAIHLTPTARDAFDTKAKEAGLSRSEYLEQLARSLI